MTDTDSSTNHAELFRFLGEALKNFRSTPPVDCSSLMGTFRASQARISVRLARELNENNLLMQLPVDVLHILLHHVGSSSSFLQLSQTSRVLRDLINQTGLVAFNHSEVAPSCRRAECSKSFRSDLVLHQTSRLCDELQQRLPTVRSVTLRLMSNVRLKKLIKLGPERWRNICAALNQPAARLEGLTLHDTSGIRDPRLTIPVDIFAGSAPCLKTVTLKRISLSMHWQNEGFTVPSAFAGLTSLDYQPPRRNQTRAELASILEALPQLLALSLRVDTVTANDLMPIPHHLQSIRINNLREGHNDVYCLLFKDSATLRRFEVRHAIGHWWQLFDKAIPTEYRRELVIGQDITELDIASPSPDPGLGKLRFYHSDGIGELLLRTNAQWLTRVTLHHLLWPAQKEFMMPEAPCLTELHVFINNCSPFIPTGYPRPQDIFLADKDMSWRVPALRSFSLSYVVSNPDDSCTNEYHSCCWRGRMLISVQVLAKTVTDLLVFERKLLDEIRFSDIEFYESEPAAVELLKTLAQDVVSCSQPFVNPAAMHARLPLPALEI